MSNRSLLEFNHDLGPRHGWSIETLADYAEAIARYLGSGDKADLPKGVTFIQMRHHSDPAPTGWLPPQDRPHGYWCLGWMRGSWSLVTWDEQPHNNNPRPFWHSYSWGSTISRKHPPTAFAPLPADAVGTKLAQPPRDDMASL